LGINLGVSENEFLHGAFPFPRGKTHWTKASCLGWRQHSAKPEQANRGWPAADQERFHRVRGKETSGAGRIQRMELYWKNDLSGLHRSLSARGPEKTRPS